MSSSRRSPVTEIPRDIREQEGEIESMFRNLVRSGDCAGLHRSEDWPDDTRILMAVLAFISIIGFYLLWLRSAG
jgi:hypothetical protein